MCVELLGRLEVVVVSCLHGLPLLQISIHLAILQVNIQPVIGFVLVNRGQAGHTLILQTSPVV
jgi:hypothetical protein